MAVVSNGTTIIDAGALGAGVATGKLVLLSTQTASSSGTLTFASSINSTYDSYIFQFINIHPATDGAVFQCNGRDGGSSYDSTKTTTFFYGYNNESGSDRVLQYNASYDITNSTSPFRISNLLGNGNDESYSGTMQLFAPSSTTFVKHFIIRANHYQSGDYIFDIHVAGYFRDTAAIDGIQFSMSSGNIDAGTIKMFGVGG